MSGDKKRVLVVDDSVFARKIVSDLLSSCPSLEVIGAAKNGREALEMVRTLRPDVVTMDVEMPELDGITALKHIMRETPVPVVMLSSLTVQGARTSLQALQYGAVDIMAKPHGSHSLGLTAHRDELVKKVLSAASIDVSHLRPVTPVRSRISPSAAASVRFPVVIIASSTGGPRALRTLMPGLSTSPAAAYVIVQHLPEGFSGPFAEDLNTTTDLQVHEAQDGDMIRAGEVLVAKSGYHCVVETGGVVRLARTPPLWGVRPAADVTMVSATPVFGPRLIGVVLTGMGRDGTDGIRLIRQVGGQTIAEHESSSVVYGMPRSAIESGAVDTIAPLHNIPQAINAAILQCESNRRRPAA